METPRDKMIKLWKQTCETAEERLEGEYIKWHQLLPKNVGEFINSSKDYDSLVANHFGVKIEDVYSCGKEEYLYFIYDDIPPLILERVKYIFSGDIKTKEVSKYVDKGFIFKKQVLITEKIDDPEDIDRIKSIYPNCEIKDNHRYKTPSQIGAALVFGNHTCILSREEAGELIEMYFEAGRRIDLKIMEERIKETS